MVLLLFQRSGLRPPPNSYQVKIHRVALGKKCGEEKPECERCSKSGLTCRYGFRKQNGDNGGACVPSSHDISTASPTRSVTGAGEPSELKREVGRDDQNAQGNLSSPLSPHETGSKDARQWPKTDIAHSATYVHQSSIATSSLSNVQDVASLALSHNQSWEASVQEGQVFLPNLEEQLFLEHKRCILACKRFNDLDSPYLDEQSSSTRTGLFFEIFFPGALLAQSGLADSVPGLTPRPVGSNVIVNTPFLCDYGHNISIGDDVIFRSNCIINNVGMVSIGARCVIGPNVKIITEAVNVDHRTRAGDGVLIAGIPITIEEDCIILGGATICPGVTVGRNSTVEHGSVVVKDVLPYTVVGGNPAGVLSHNNPSAS
ncbi:hypothetical protein FSARC_1882 [Fusarium sarcochroum]|uniref:Mannose-1-phosphate guanylyltransferase n=1 Tax=Fusarium sarcochroum TaxID=1208366 RepID=A0A8H4U7Y6_9HYPO|nr:hypothetical protein FSARC_1882 [Fusarium sarcochroum]